MRQARKAKGAYVRTDTTNGKMAGRGKGARSLKDHVLHGKQNDKIEVFKTCNISDRNNLDAAFKEILEAAAGLRVRSDRTAFHGVINPPPGVLWTAEQERLFIAEYLKTHGLTNAPHMVVKHFKAKAADVIGKQVMDAHYHVIASIFDLQKGELIDLNNIKKNDMKFRSWLAENGPESPFYKPKYEAQSYTKKNRAMTQKKFGKSPADFQKEIIEIFRNTKTRAEFAKEIKEKGFALGKSSKHKQGRIWMKKDEKGLMRGLGFGPSKIKKLLPEKEQKKFAEFTSKPKGKTNPTQQAAPRKQGKAAGKGKGSGLIGGVLGALFGGGDSVKKIKKQTAKTDKGTHPIIKAMSFANLWKKEKQEAKAETAQKMAEIEAGMKAYAALQDREAAEARRVGLNRVDPDQAALPVWPDFKPNAMAQGIKDENAMLMDEMRKDYANAKTPEERKLLDEKWGALKADLENRQRYGAQAQTRVLRPMPQFKPPSPSF